MRPNQKSNKEIWKLRKKIKLKSENFYSRLGFNWQKVRNVWTCNLRLFFLKSFFFSSRVLLFISLMVMNLASQCWACNILSNPNNATCDFLFWMKHNLQLSLNGLVILFCFVLFIFYFTGRVTFKFNWTNNFQWVVWEKVHRVMATKWRHSY